MSRAFLLAMLLCLAACAHQADLKSPSQIAKEEKQKEARDQKEAQRAQQRAKRAAARQAIADEEEKTSEEVTVPGVLE